MGVFGRDPSLDWFSQPFYPPPPVARMMVAWSRCLKKGLPSSYRGRAARSVLLAKREKNVSGFTYSRPMKDLENTSPLKPLVSVFKGNIHPLLPTPCCKHLYFEAGLVGVGASKELQDAGNWARGSLPPPPAPRTQLHEMGTSAILALEGVLGNLNVGVLPSA